MFSGIHSLHCHILFDISGFPGGSDGKASACNAGDLGLIPGSGRSPGEGNGNPLQYFCLENSVDRGAWWATVHGVAKGLINNPEEASNSQSEEHLLNNWSVIFQ